MERQKIETGSASAWLERWAQNVETGVAAGLPVPRISALDFAIRTWRKGWEWGTMVKAPLGTFTSHIRGSGFESWLCLPF